MTFNQSVLSYRTMKLSWEKHGEETISEVKSLTRVQLFGTPWTVAHQAPPSMEFSRQEYWSELPFPSGRGREADNKEATSKWARVYNGEKCCAENT